MPRTMQRNAIERLPEEQNGDGQKRFFGSLDLPQNDMRLSF